jgi:monoamine oxidase
MDSSDNGSWSRRDFLHMLGAVGGGMLAYEAMTAMGLINLPAAYAKPLKLTPGTGKGKKVIILGAGIAGMTAAYVLRSGGYDVEILEASHRAGGRNFTVRKGDKIVEEDEDGQNRTEQECKFDKGQYLNAGPGRIPYHHTAVLEYCNELKVPLEMYVMSTRANLYQTPLAFDARPVYNRQVTNDTRGWISELLAKCVQDGSLDQTLTNSDRLVLLNLLEKFGEIRKNAAGRYEYLGSSRSGYTTPPAITQKGTIVPPLKFDQLLLSGFWNQLVYQPEDYLWQPTLFQPRDGMDGIVKGFVREVGSLIKLNRIVEKITNVTDGVEIVHRNGLDRKLSSTTRADWCISTIPLPVLKRIPNNFSRDFQHAIETVPFESTCKVGWQADYRFWEAENQMYGGISYINHNITQMWYPSFDFFGKKGVLTGAYNYDDDADKMAALKPEERLDLAIDGAERLHPNFTRFVKKRLGLSIAWKRVPYQRGGWADWRKGLDAEYRRLLQHDGRVWIAGDQISQLTGWQEGAIRSAEYVVSRIALPSPIPINLESVEAPDARAMTIGSSVEDEK